MSRCPKTALGFTPREWQLIALKAQSLPDKEVAYRLGLSANNQTYVAQRVWMIRHKAALLFGPTPFSRADSYLFRRLIECLTS